jgi:hypothetical protein
VIQIGGAMNEPGWYKPSVLAVRYLLGVQYLISGLGWWFKILPFPSLSDGAAIAQKHAVARAMIETGWMYELAKGIEVLTGLSLIFNLYVPLMLVVSMSVALTTFLLDAWIGQTLVAWLSGRASFAVFRAKFLDMAYFGGAVFLMQGYLMFAYLRHYRPMLSRRAAANTFDPVMANTQTSHRLMALFAIVALFLGATSTFWMIGLINQWAIPWRSLAILAPPR